MKANFKKVMAASLSAMMVMSMGVATNIQAAGSIELTPTSEGVALTGRTFTAYKLFNVTKEANGSLNYSEVDAKTTAAVVKAIRATITKYNADEKNVDVPTLEKETVKDVVNYLTSDAILNNSKFHIELAKQLQKETTLTAVKGNFEESGSSLIKKDLEDGYYLVLETPREGKDVSLAILQTVCGATLSIPVKSDTPTIDKTVNGKQDVDDYQIGDTIPFELTAKAPSKGTLSHYDTYSFKMTDTLSEGLTLNTDSIQFEIGSETTSITIEGSNVMYDGASIGTITTSSNSLVVDFNLKSDKFESLFANASSMNTIKVTYTAELNAKAVIGDPDSNAQNNNKVVLEYNNNPSQSEVKGKDEDDVNVYSYGLEIVKQDARDTDKKLSGAKFKLYKNSVSDENLVKFTEQNGKYIVDKNGVTEEVITNDQGMLNIDGLDDGTYVLVETEAPEGFNKLKEPITIEITPEYNGKDLVGLTYVVSGGDGEASNTGVADQATGTVSVTVNNNSGFELPSTGGMGTTILYGAGILAMAGGVCYFVMDKKRRAQQ